jgi:transposase
MITPAMEAEIRRLVLREGFKIETVARQLGVHHSVVRRVIQPEGTPPIAPRPPIASKLDPFKPYIVDRLHDHPELTSTRLLLELKERGYEGGVAQIKRYARAIRAPRARKAYLRVETEPGEQAQVDWGSFGQMRIGNTTRPLSCFAMVLSWSRALYIDFSLDQRADTFLRMHQRAFAAFGGVPRKVLYDNLKTVVLHHVGSTVQFNPSFLAFAGHALFEPVAAPVRYPQAKGRVEGAIKYVRHAFFYGRSFANFDALRDAARLWCSETANQRIHSTTRERPADRLLVERTRLHALPTHAFDADTVLPVVISKEARVWLDSNSYSVPPEHVGKNAFIRADDGRVRVVSDNVVIADHARSWERRQHIIDKSHIDALLDKRPAARPFKRRDHIAALSDHARVYLQEISRRRIHLDHEIRKLDRLAALYGVEDLKVGIAAALAARTFGAKFVRYHLDQARFARGLGEPPEPITTGNREADDITVEPHNLGDYDDLF